MPAERPNVLLAPVDGLVSPASVPGTPVELAESTPPPSSKGAPPPACSTAGTASLPDASAPAGATRCVACAPASGCGDCLRDQEAELYDLQADPGETENLAGDPVHADTQARLHGLVLDWWEETGGDEDAWAEPVPD